MKKLLSILIIATLASCATQKVLQVQDYEKVNDKWIPTGKPHVVPDTVKVVHIYSWINGKHIYSY